jgi:S1-C subfamily serine protease
MAADDDDADDGVRFGQPLPPEDRLWRHPSEVATTLLRDDGGDPRSWGLALVAGLAGAVLATGVVAAFGGLGTRVVNQEVVERVALQPIGATPLASADLGATRIAEHMSAAIVRIEMDVDGAVTAGSGVVFRDDGYLVTSAHVVDGADELAVVLSDGRRLPAEVDELTDVALLKVDGNKLATAVLGTSQGLAIGQPVFAIGSSVGVSKASITTGVISAVGRRVDADDGDTLHDMLQIDAPVAPAAAGGALCDDRGAVVGLTTSVVDGDGQLGFAIPIDLVLWVAHDIIETGRARHVWIGVEGIDLDMVSAPLAGVDAGAHVRDVVEGGPAALAGLQADDVIVAIDGRPVASMSALVIALRGHRPGDSVAMDYVRSGNRHTLKITLAEHPRA